MLRRKLFFARAGRFAAWLAAFMVGGQAVSAEATAPNVVLAWPAGLLEVRVVLDGPMDPEVAQSLAGKTVRLDTGLRNVASWRRARLPLPPTASASLKVAGVRLADHGRMIVLATDPHPCEGLYTLGPLDPAWFRSAGPGVNITREREGVFLHYDLTGTWASWDDGSDQAPPRWSGWWPSLDPELSRTLTRGSPEHEAGFVLLSRSGRLTVSSLVTLPRGRVALRVTAPVPVEATFGGDALPAVDNLPPADLPESTGEPTDLTVSARTANEGRPLRIHALYRMAGEAAERGISPDRLLVPWALAARPDRAPPAAPPFEIAGGDRHRGEALFFAERTKCSHCHKIRDKGGIVGPDLTGLAGRPLAEVFQAIAEPSATISPQYVAFTVVVRDGRIMSGLVRAEGSDAIRVTDTEGKTTVVLRDVIEEVRPSGTSIMPVGLVGAIGQEAIRDLLAFLTTGGGAAK